MKEKIFVARRLTKKYKKSYALNGLDMEICRGSIYGFVGKNVLRYEQKTGSLFRYL